MTLIPTTQKRPFIAAPGCVQVEMIYSHLGQIMENVYHVRVGDGSTEPTETQMQGVANAFNQWETAAGRNGRNSGCKLTLVRVRQLGIQSGLVVELTPVGNVTGNIVGVPAPGNVTAAVRWSTGQGGRSFRGRTYLIGLDNSSFAGNQLTTVSQTGFVSNYAGLITGVAAVAGCKLVVVSYAHNNFWRDPAVATDILQCSVDINMDSQRRRLTGRGN